MLIGLGTGSSGTAELARLLGLPHEERFLPWKPDSDDLGAFLAHDLPRIEAQGGEVGLYLLPYAEHIIDLCPEAKFVCMQRDQARTVAGLTRKLGRNVFADPEANTAFNRGFPLYGGVTLAEGAARFYRDYYEAAYTLQRKHPERFQVFFTDHLLGSEVADISDVNIERLARLSRMTHEALNAFCGDEVQRLLERAEVA